MALEIRQQLKLVQQLVMTPQLQQAIKLLQLSRLELVSAVEQEMEENPLLEDDPQADGDAAENEIEVPEPQAAETTSEVTMEGDGAMGEIDWQNYINEYDSLPSARGTGEVNPDLPSRLDILSRKPDLQSHLNWQLGLSDLDDTGREVGQFIIGNINRDGYLEVDIETIVVETGVSGDIAARVLALVQDMDPVGVGARNVRECLLLQLEKLGLGDSLAAKIVSEHMKLLEHRNYSGLVRVCRRKKEEVFAAVESITGLDPYPGRQYADEDVQYIVPDVYVKKVDGEYVIILNDDGMPRLRLSGYYRRIMEKADSDPAARDYIKDKLKSATWLIKSIQQRQRTIYRVVESIVKFQQDFFDRGVEYLRPMVLRDVAEDIEMHESTISRVTSNKYVHTPQGIYELKYFFNSAISRADGGEAHSSATIKNRIKAMVADEDPGKPLSDQAIADMFKAEEVRLARRTVAKYREQMGILPSKLRRKPV